LNSCIIDINEKVRGIMNTKTKILIGLIVLAIFDTFIPIPFTTLLLIYVVLDKPGWFKDFYDEVYWR
jgi:hypothetical protein